MNNNIKNTSNRLSLWYRQPASQWDEALPVGNGRFGGMVFGGIQEETLKLNEDSIWYGGPKDGENPDGLKNLPIIRQLLFDGKVKKATELLRKALFSTPKYYNPYIPLGELKIYFSEVEGQLFHYRRELNLADGVVNIAFKAGENWYQREVFCSYPDQIMVIRLSCNRPGGLNFYSGLYRRPYEGQTKKLGSDSTLMNGECGRDGIEFSCLLRITDCDGIVSTIGDYVQVENATRATLLVSTNTTYRIEKPAMACFEQADTACEKGYEQLRKRHTEDYHKLINRVQLNLPSDEDINKLPTDERLNRVKEGAMDHGLEEIFFQFGRYLMIASSRPGCLPSNLQGIWNDSYTPSWESKYTININTEMNYWPAEICGLSECHEPLFDHIDKMRKKGRITAKFLYGCNGFVAHHNTNLWAETRPEGLLPTCVVWPMGGAWLSLHLWEHYSFTQDNSFLKDKAYPVLKEAAEFFLDYLVEAPDGTMVTGPSVSPENSYLLPDGKEYAVCMGPSMDSQILSELFDACIKSSQILNLDRDFSEKITCLKQRLPKIKIGKYGQVMEWCEDYEEAQPGHRHISQLFALHPGGGISPAKTPELAVAARKTLERRLENGGGHTGWSCAWIINMYARLEDGEEAYRFIRNLFSKSTYPNLFDAHPPFQIDGNFGGIAGMAEMLLQSHNGEIKLLPALPKAWKSGSVKGLMARGGYRIDMAWEEGRLKEAQIFASHTGKLRLRLEDGYCIKKGPHMLQVKTMESSVAEFECTKGETYTLALFPE